MNVIKVYGGLGNQLFQYAFGKAMMHNGIDVRFDLDYFRVKRDPPRTYALDKFYTTGIKTARLGSGKEINDVKQKYIMDLNYLSTDNCDFYGYWQHPEYWLPIFSELKEEFRVRKELYTESFVELRQKMICIESISLHVRRTDYVQINGHFLLSMEYYIQALKYVVGQVYVFSDDIAWCKTQLPSDFIFVDIGDYLAFDLMRVCKHNIIANSTFSWWAAYLNDNPNKIVVTPKRWRKDPNDPAFCDPFFLQPQGWYVVDSPGIVS
jgi:hypothetical protein